MKLKYGLTLALSLLSLALIVSLTTSCSSNGNQDSADAARTQEIDRLRQENQALAQVRTDNEEVQKLKQENQDLPKLRSQYQEAGRLEKENAQLRQQVAKMSPSSATQHVASATAPGTADTLAPGSDSEKDKKAAAAAELALQEGDDILIEPKYLKQLLPEFDWEKLGRKDALGVRALLEKDGVQITNAAQLHEYGITNFVIQRAVLPPMPPGQENPAPK